MMYEVRVERPDGFYHHGRLRRQDSIIIVDEATWKQHGSPGTARLALVKERPDKAGEHVPASPEARDLARQRGINLCDVTGSGVDGKVLVGDVRDYRGPAHG